MPLVRPLPLLLLAAATACGPSAPEGSGASAHAGPSPCSKPQATQTCTTDDGLYGVQTCQGTPTTWGTCQPAPCTGAVGSCRAAGDSVGEFGCTEDHLASTACATAGQCHPGAPQECGTEELASCCSDCEISSDGVWTWTVVNENDCSTPLVLSLDERPVVFTRARGEFDLSGRDASYDTDWVSAATPWLALDLDGDGRIGDGRELFGSMTVLPSGARAHDGFEALRALDDDGDGAITPSDAAFARLVLWSDADQDRRSAPDELVTLRDAGVLAIRLDDSVVPRCSGGDCEVERARVTYRDDRGIEREGAVIDVHLARR